MKKYILFLLLLAPFIGLAQPKPYTPQISEAVRKADSLAWLQPVAQSDTVVKATKKKRAAKVKPPKTDCDRLFWLEAIKILIPLLTGILAGVKSH